MNWKFWLLLWVPIGSAYLGAEWLILAIYKYKLFTWKHLLTQQWIHKKIVEGGYFGPLTPFFKWLIWRKNY